MLPGSAPEPSDRFRRPRSPDSRGGAGAPAPGQRAMSSRCRSSWCASPIRRLLFRALVGRYHYLGHTVPFGAHLRYRSVVDSFGTFVLVAAGRDARVRGRVGDGIVTAELGFAGSPGARLEAGCSFGWNLLGLVGATPDDQRGPGGCGRTTEFRRWLTAFVAVLLELAAVGYANITTRPGPAFDAGMGDDFEGSSTRKRGRSR